MQTSNEQILKKEFAFPKVSKYQETKTGQNLQKAMEAEALAYAKYTCFSSICKIDGYMEMSKKFEEIANNELEHFKVWFKELFGKVKTIDVMRLSRDSERYEGDKVYKEFSEVAKEEDYKKLSEKFALVSQIEKSHEQIFENFVKALDEMTVFEKEHEITWECSNCGYKYVGFSAENVCPVCDHGMAYFKECTESKQNKN